MKKILTIFLFLLFVVVTKGDELFSQVASSDNFILYALDLNCGSTSVDNSDFRISSTNFKVLSNLGGNATSSNNFESLNYLLQSGFEYSINLPPKVVVDSNRFPRNDGYLYTQTPYFTMQNSGDYNLKDRLDFRVEVSTDSNFNNVIYDKVTRSDLTGWSYSTDGGNTFQGFPSSGIEQQMAYIIKHLSQELLPLSKLYWRVYALDDFEFSFPSSKYVLNLTKKAVDLTSPSNSEIIKQNQLTLSWQANPGGVEYEIVVGQDPDLSDGVSYYTSNLNYTLTGLIDGRYFWKVRAIDVLGNFADFSSIFKFFINTITVVAAELTAAVPFTNPGSSVLLTARLIGSDGSYVPVYSLFDFTFQVIQGTGTLENEILFNDRVEVDYHTSNLAEISNVKVTENRSGMNYSDEVSIVTTGEIFLLNNLYNPKNIRLNPTIESTILSFKVLSASEDALITTIYINFEYPKNAQLLGNLKLIEDINNNGVYDASVDRIAAEVVRDKQSSRITYFNKLNDIIPRGVPINYIITADFEPPLNDAEFSATIDPNNFIIATGLVSRSFLSSSGERVTGGPVIISGLYETTPGIALLGEGSNNPRTRYERNNARDVPVLHFSVSSAPYDDLLLRKLSITAYGTANDKNDIASVKLYKDTDENGILDESKDIYLGSAKYSADDGSLDFSNLNITIPKSSGVMFLVVYDLSGTASNGEYLQASIKKGSIEVVSKTTGLPVEVRGADEVKGTVVRIEKKSSLLVNSLPVRDSKLVLSPGTTKSVFSLVTSNTSIDPVTITSIKVDLLASGYNYKYVEELILIEDKNYNCKYDEGDEVIKTQWVSSSSPTLTFSGLNIPLSASESKMFLMQAHLSKNIRDLFPMKIVIRSPEDVVASGSVVDVIGPPLSSPVIVVEKSTTGEGNLPPESGGGGGGGGCYVKPTDKNGHYDVFIILLLLYSLVYSFVIILKSVCKVKVFKESGYK